VINETKRFIFSVEALEYKVGEYQKKAASQSQKKMDVDVYKEIIKINIS
jgi:hypothetical protein